MTDPLEPVRYFQYAPERVDSIDAEVIVEKLVSLTVNGEVWLNFLCTPVDLEFLAVGFLYNESIISSKEDIASVRVCPTQDNVDVWLNKKVAPPKEWQRTSGCAGGVTQAEPRAQPHLANGRVLTSAQVFSLVDQLFAAQELYRRSGGVHTSALSDGTRLHVVSEDIGRHNSLDKIAGRCLMQGIHLDHPVLITTGRISSEMLQKSSRLGASVVASRTSPSSMSIRLAEELGITLIGYARRARFNVYTHPERILPPGSQNFTSSGALHGPADYPALGSNSS